MCRLRQIVICGLFALATKLAELMRLNILTIVCGIAVATCFYNGVLKVVEDDGEEE